jgi:hypothetical protein
VRAVTNETEGIAVRVVETPTGYGDVDVATQGWAISSPLDCSPEAHESWVSALDTIRKQVDLDANIGEVVATLIVDVETRRVRDWTLESDVEDTDD